MSFNNLVFPYLNKALQSKIQNLKSKIVVLDMAVLFESGFYTHADIIIFVKVSGSGMAKSASTRMKNCGRIRKDP